MSLQVTAIDFSAEKRDMYLAFKALNVSQTGYLTEEEFMDVYSISKLKWKVSFSQRWCQLATLNYAEVSEQVAAFLFCFLPQAARLFSPEGFLPSGISAYRSLANRCH